MAPELLVGDFSCHSFASDFWSLGCILYECAVGQPPFVSSSLNVLVDSILHKDVHLPSYVEGRERVRRPGRGTSRAHSALAILRPWRTRLAFLVPQELRA